MPTVALPGSDRPFVLKGRGTTLVRLFGLLVFTLPGAGFIAGLFVVRGRPEFAFLEHAALWPWELWAIALGGTLGLVGGSADFVWHVRGFRDVSRREERGEIFALACGGLPLFLLMAAASIAPDPRIYVLPVAALAMITVALVCYDEFVYHRKACGRAETLFHRLLTLGNGAAFLAWFHWVFARSHLGA